MMRADQRHLLHVAAVRLREQAVGRDTVWMMLAAEACLYTARVMRTEPWRGVPRREADEADVLPEMERSA